MDIWRFFDITHRDHVLCNPISSDKIDDLIALLRLEPGASVLDIACGKGEFIVRLAERYDIVGVGVDISPYFVADAKKNHEERIPNAQLSFVEMDGADYQPTGACDLVACLGATWVFGGYVETLKTLREMATPGGWIIVGEPYWRKEPEKGYLEAVGEEQSTYGTHHDNASAGEESGLTLVYTVVSSPDDWDKYEGLRWYAAEEWAREHPDDPITETLLARTRANKAEYLKWGRETMGWAIYMFRNVETDRSPAA